MRVNYRRLLLSCPAPALQDALNDITTALFSRTGATGHVQATDVEDKRLRELFPLFSGVHADVMTSAALRCWSVHDLRSLQSAGPLLETLRARASRQADALSRQRDSLPPSLTILPSVTTKLATSFSTFSEASSSSPHASIHNLDTALRSAVESLQDASETERLHPTTQSTLSAGFANLISARILLWRLDQLQGPPPKVLPSSTDGWNPTDVPAAAAAAESAEGAFNDRPYLSDLIYNSADDMRAFCREKFGDAAEIDIRSPSSVPSHLFSPPTLASSSTDTSSAPTDGPVVLPSYVQFVLQELLKNALASHVYKSGVENLDELPDIEVSYGLLKQNRDGLQQNSNGLQQQWGYVSVLDHGGGWPAGGAEHAARFLTSSRPGRARGVDDASWQYSRAHGSQFEGMGAGLALARLHAGYLGGGLSLGGEPGSGAHAVFTFDMSGHGTDGAPLD